MKRDSRSSHPASRRRIAVVDALALLVPSGGAGQTSRPPPAPPSSAVNVYKNDGGGWQKHENGGCGSASAGLDSSTAGQLGNDMRARGEGGARASAWHGFRNIGSWGSGSFRGGGSRRR
jgi:hypothetical protein